LYLLKYDIQNKVNIEVTKKIILFLLCDALFCCLLVVMVLLSYL